ncbi:MAG: site-2 protease family protein [Acidobacteriota bacterium]
MTSLDLSDTLVAFAVLIVSLTFHEAAHAWTADRLGDSTARRLGRLSLNPMVHVDLVGTIIFPFVAMTTGLPLIGWAKPVPVNTSNLWHPRRDFARVALAGPVSNLVLAAAAALLLRLDPVGLLDLSPWVARAVVLFVVLNVLLAVFNMIPIPPLDGGNVLMGVLPEVLAALVDKLRGWGFLLLYVLMLSGLLGSIVLPIRNEILSWLL